MDIVISNKMGLAVALSVAAYMADRSEPEGFFSCGKAIKVRDIDNGDYRLAWTFSYHHSSDREWTYYHYHESTILYATEKEAQQAMAAYVWARNIGEI